MKTPITVQKIIAAFRTMAKVTPAAGQEAPYTGMTVGVPKNSTGRGATVGYRWAFD